MSGTITPFSAALEENWGALRTLSLYRWSVATLLLALWWTDLGNKALPSLNEELLPLLCGLYLIACPLLSLSILFRRPGFQYQAYLHAAVDISLTTLLIMVSGGVGSGLGILMLTPVGGIGTLVHRRLSILFAAVATIAVLGEEIARDLYGMSPQADYTLAGLLGALLFIVCFAANTLAQRATASAELAKQRGVDVANLSHLNERIIQHMAVGVLVLDEKHHIAMMNQAAANIFGENPQRIRQKKLAVAAPELQKALLAWKRSPEKTDDGEVIEIKGQQCLPHFSQMGAHDEPMLIFLEDAQRYGEQTQQIKLAALGRLTASVAHEIRNPLGAISHASQLIQQWENSPDEEERLLEIIDNHCQRINQIIESILNLSRRQETIPQAIQLEKWLSECVEEYNQTDTTPSSVITIDAFEPEVVIRFDPNHLRQVIHNLWDNASRHSDSSDTTIITLSAGWEESAERHYLDITDNGPGVEPQIQDKIFEPFFTNQHSGTGLGLYLARELCECNQASLRLLPSEHGACFRILFTKNLEWAA